MLKAKKKSFVVVPVVKSFSFQNDTSKNVLNQKMPFLSVINNTNAFGLVAQ